MKNRSFIFTKEQKRSAAYALNMCMVSVSQIIDYDDLYVLEQEYDGILNNLNLENMPKDEALLHILKQLLDTISYFRIADKERELQEKEYQQRMKNAIWSAVPTVGLISTGGTPVSMAVSLASQIGIGYMNYRRAKAAILLEKEKNEWRLQRTAMEQFHGLRRELFDTAWRLAERYQFPDEYRITERQITEFNNILLDEDKLRRYERLDYVREKFEAYPPFWYYLGSAANAIAQDEDYGDGVRETHRQYAKEAFCRYLNETEHNLLREDQLLASCALEYFELMLPELQEDEDGRKKLEKLIDRALAAAGNQYDVLELCALSYLRLGGSEERKKGAVILRMLVNHSYNKIVNAQLLSSLYVSDYIQHKDDNNQNAWRDDYATLGSRLGIQGARFLFPMPNDGENKEQLEAAFLDAQRGSLSQKALWMMKTLVEKYTVRYNRAIPAADLNDNHDDAYFSDALRAIRRDDTLKLMRRGGDQWAEFIERMRPYVETVFQTLNDLQTTLSGVPSVDKQRTHEALAAQIQAHDEIILRAMDPEQLTEEEMRDLFDAVSFRTMAGGALGYAAERLREYVGTARDMKEIARAETTIQTICDQENLPMPEVALREYEQESNATESELCKIGLSLLGEPGRSAQRQKERKEGMIACLEKRREELFVEDERNRLKVKFLLNSDKEDEFKRYKAKNKELVKRVQGEVLAVINDTTLLGTDILFTTDDVVYREGLPRATHIVPYEAVSQEEQGAILIGENKYTNKQINMQALYSLIQELADIREKYKSEQLKAISNCQSGTLSGIETWDHMLQFCALPGAADDSEGQQETLAESSPELEKMTAKATKAVYAAMTTAAAVSAIPIPLVDWAMLIAQQVALMMKISSIFGLDVKKDGLKALVTTALDVGGATIAGGTIAVNILEFAPFAGSALGGAISAGTAGSVTLALGTAFIEVCKNIKLGKLSADDLLAQTGKDMLIKEFEGQMTKKKNA